MMFATVAFSIDAMLPAFPDIAAELSPEAPNRAQLILTSFLLGMGLGTFVAGPMSDAFGRKPVILGGAVLYCVGSLLAWGAGSLELVLAARVMQGLGAAGPRIVTLALLRDLYAGRQMARIMSFAMMVFTLVPAIAPAVGAEIIALTGWRGIFLAFVAFSLVSALWLGLRQPETLAPDRRRPMRLVQLVADAREVMGNRVVQLSILVQSMLFGALFGVLSSIQMVFDQTFGRGESFPIWFALIALVAGLSGLLNALLVVRLGMRRLIRLALVGALLLSAAMAVVTLAGLWPEPLFFPAYVIWTTVVFFMAGMTLGNVNAIALEPMGHVAGMAASVVAASATVAGASLAIPAGLAFDGTPGPLALAISLMLGAALLLMRRMPD